MNTGAARLGIAITTFNRRDMLLAQIDALQRLTTRKFDVVICDDGSTDDTRAAMHARGIPVITGVNRGIAWNKNRGLFYLREILGCDIILLLDDDIIPVQPGWQQDWIDAAQRHGHVNFMPTGDKILSGANTPADPGITSTLWGPCIATSRQALSYVGYFDSRFKGYGHEHTDFTMRAIRAGFGGFTLSEPGGPVDRFHAIEGGLKLLPSKSNSNTTTIATNQGVWASSQNEPIYRHAWRDDAEYEVLRGELAALDGLGLAAPYRKTIGATRTAPQPNGNLAFGKQAAQSPRGEAGSTDPWWQVDLGQPEKIAEIRIFNVATPDLQNNFSRFSIAIGYDIESLADVFRMDNAAPAGGITNAPFIWQPKFSAWGRFVRITILGGTKLHPDQVEIYGKPQAPWQPPPIPDAALFKQFISLGDNCEFGLVQRAAGIEPLDLLRFGGTGADETGLLLALRERFADFASATDLVLADDAGEWISSSRRTKIVFHTHRRVTSIDRDTVFAKEVKRLKFLSRLLVRDISAGKKILVRKSNKKVSDGTMHELHRAIRDIGPATLLWVTEVDAEHPEPGVRKIADGLLRGYISRLAPYEDAHDIRLEDWRALCIAALQAQNRPLP